MYARMRAVIIIALNNRVNKKKKRKEEGKIEGKKRVTPNRARASR